MKNKGVLILSSAMALITAGHALSVPFFAIYLSVQRHVSMGKVGFFLAASMLISAFAQGLGGEMSDKFGRKKVMQWALFIRMVSMFLMAGAIYQDVYYGWLIVFHFAGEFCTMLFAPAAFGFVADTVGPRKRIEAYGLLRIGLNLGWALGPMMGGWLALKSYSFMFFITGMTYIVCMAIIWLFIKEPAVLRQSVASVRDMFLELKNKTFAKFCFYNVLIAVAMSQLVVLTFSNSLYLSILLNLLAFATFAISELLAALYALFLANTLSLLRL
ncbi:MAG: MFS transporter [Elusimicrobia bacterium]|nr:MFS transporter [Elusimicrobiota bacterium]